jgi:ubiquitin-conjugating enzyme E2 variant
MSASRHALPVHYELTRGQYAASSAAIAACVLLITALTVRLAAGGHLAHCWVPLALAAGAVAADLVSGLVHWGADTWGRDDTPVVGPRLLVPFRVHHVNPDDFLRRRFVDTNGEVAMIAAPALTAVLMLPFEASWGPPAAVVGLAFCGLGMMTNQIHQWAHQPAPPRPVRALQACGILLGRAEHEDHHRRPHDRRYCITTGWLNAPLDTCGFFKRLEAIVTWSTGMTPRHDDRRYATACGELGAAGERRRV